MAFTSARTVAAHVRAVSEQFSDWNRADQRMLNTLVSLLSYSLQVVTSHDYTLQIPSTADPKHTPKHCLPDSSIGPHVTQEGSIPTNPAVQLVDDILQTASDLILVRRNTRHLEHLQKSPHTVSNIFH